MTERDITGDAVKSAYRRAQLVAKDRELTDDDLREIAAGVREFDAQRDPGQRLAVALEKLVDHFTSVHRGGDGVNSSFAYEQQRLRRREVYAQELFAVALILDDANNEVLAQIRRSPAFGRLANRLAGEPNASTPDSATP